jgi:hypothetical protein
MAQADQTENPQVLKYDRPKLNRPAVVEQLNARRQLFDFAIFGDWQLILKHFYVEASKKPGGKPAYYATCKIISSTAPQYLPGQVASFWFPIGRGPTPTDPKREDRDDARTTQFIRAVFRVPPGAPFDSEQGLDELLLKGKIESDALVFNYSRVAQSYKQEIKCPVTKEVLKTIDRVGSQETFSAYAPPVAAPAAPAAS